jgi:hypothetical protein
MITEITTELSLKGASPPAANPTMIKPGKIHSKDMQNLASMAQTPSRKPAAVTDLCSAI